MVLTFEGVGHYALHGVGSLHLEDGWKDATAEAGGASWRFVGSGVWSFRRNATATDAGGNVIGDYRHRGRALRWRSRELQLRRARLWRTFGWRALLTGGVHCVLADRERILAEVNERMRRSHAPLNIDVEDAAALEPGLLLFVAFLVGWLDMRDRNNDGL